MGRHRKCTNFEWREQSPEYQYQQANDRIVFRKIKRECDLAAKRGERLRITILVRQLDNSPLWHDRLIGKTPESWKRCYNRWRQSCRRPVSPSVPTPSPAIVSGLKNIEKRDTVQAKKHARSPCPTHLSSKRSRHFREMGP